jgi:hypothetical protein
MDAINEFFPLKKPKAGGILRFRLEALIDHSPFSGQNKNICFNRKDFLKNKNAIVSL